LQIYQGIKRSEIFIAQHLLHIYLKALSKAINLKNLKQNLQNEEATLSNKSDFSFEEGVAKIYIDPKCLESE
jgi:hypothetical protein